jgi:hypothetical protein
VRFEKGHLRPRSSPRALVVRRSRLERGGRDGTGRLYCGEHPADGEWSQHWLCAQWGQTNKGGRQQTWYICSLDYEADNRGRACFHTRQDVLDDAVVGHVLRRVGLSGVTREVADHLEAEGERERAGARRTRALRELLRREIGGLKKKLPWAEARADYDLLMAEIRQRERQVEQLSRPEPRADGLPTAAQVAAVAAFLGALPRAWPGVTHDTRRRFLELLLERVTVYHDGSRELYLHLRWRTGLTDVLRAHRVHPPRPEGWRWDS